MTYNMLNYLFYVFIYLFVYLFMVYLTTLSVTQTTASVYNIINSSDTISKRGIYQSTVLCLVDGLTTYGIDI
jgi:hypothetical protein